ncbi:MAG: hypothetical protein PHE56_12330, partial [Bacteroidales bacterium]|nr:hypothetical protein [Bacteroidales bacterium]
MSRKVLLFVFQLFFFLSLNSPLTCQVVPPYEQNFENLDQIDWTHYSTFGTDNWEIGAPIGAVLDEALSGENACVTNLDGNVSQNSFMCLETPEFDLSGSVNWVLSFSHQYYTYAGAGGNIEYSIDGGTNWILLNGSNTEKRSWYNTENVAVLGQSGWSGSNYNSGFVVSSHDLGFLSGQSSVKFRFKYGSGYYTYEGWVIDDFKIVEECNNIYAISGDITHASQIFTSFIVNTNLIYDGIVRPSFQNTIEYYFSYDDIWDENDSLIGTKVGNMFVTSSNWEKTFDMIPNLSHGDYYIFKKLDVNDNLDESNEDDNLSYSILRVDSTFVGMHKDNFESGHQYWNNYAKNSSYTYIGPGIWTFGNNNLHHIFGAHSGSNAWYVNDTYSLFGSNSMHYIESPFLDLTDTANYTFCFWYKLMSRSEYSGNITIQTANTGIYPFYSTSFTGNTTILNTFRINDWDCSCTDVSHLSGKENAKVRVAYKHLETYYSNHIIVIDDVYIGPALPDLKIEDEIVRTLNSLAVSDTLYYTIFNAGMFPVEPSVTKFYWSADSIFDTEDILLRETIEPTIP